MSYTLTETDAHFVLEQRGHVTTKIEIAREFFSSLTDAQKIEALVAAMEMVEEHARVRSLYAGPDGVEVVGRMPT